MHFKWPSLFYLLTFIKTSLEYLRCLNNFVAVRKVFALLLIIFNLNALSKLAPDGKATCQFDTVGGQSGQQKHIYYYMF